MAEALNERAAMLSYLSFELTDVFGLDQQQQPRLHVRRLMGGSSRVSAIQVGTLHSELLAAAKCARLAAEKILDGLAEQVPLGVVAIDGATVGVTGDMPELPEVSEEIVGNPNLQRMRTGGGR